MLYQVSRNGQMYGPYTLEDLTRYVASGNVLLTDMAKSESMPDWVPVAQLVGGPAAGYAAPAPNAAPPDYATAYAGTRDDPPNLSWGLVLLFSILTFTVFMYVWNLILAAWANRIAPASRVLPFYIAATAMAIIQAASGARMNILNGMGLHHHGLTTTHYGGGYGLITLICWIVRLIARFTMRTTLEQHYNTVEPLGLRLSGVMTFFFGGLYFQYHLNRINDMKRALAYRSGPAF